MSSPRIERKLAAIMFTDIAGYTALSAKDENKALELLDTQKQILTPIIEEFNGTLHKEMGDGLLFTFPTVTEAVKCGIKIQEDTKANADLNLRIGIHEGEITLKDGDVLGDDVNVSSRIEPFSAIGGIAISGKVQQNISSLTEFETKYIGKPKLKGVAQKVEVYCITSHKLPHTDLSKVSAKLEKESNLTKYALIGGVAILVAVLFFVFQEEEETVPSIAIIPLENKGESKDEFYSYSISADLISDVSGAGDIRVASLKDIEKIDYKSLSNDEIGKKLLVRYISQGTLWKVDSIFQLSMELYDTKKNKVEWSKNWQQNWSELPSIKGGLSGKILKNLQVTTKQDITKSESENADAYALYLKAKNIYEKRENIDDTEIAQGMLQKAIELDENLIAAKVILGDLYMDKIDYEEAMEMYSSAITKSKELDDKIWIGRSTRKIGNIHINKYELDEGIDCYERALAIAEEIGDKNGMGASLSNIGSVYTDKGDYDKALDYLSKALANAEELDDKSGMMFPLSSLGALHYYKGDFNKTLDYFGRALAIVEELGDKSRIGLILGNMGLIYSTKGNYDKALEYSGRALAIAEDFDVKRHMEDHLISLGNIYSTKGDYDKALEYFGRLPALQEELSDREGMARSLCNIGIAHFNKSDHNVAEEYLEKSLHIHKELGLDTDSIIWPISYLYLTYKHLGKQFDEKEIQTLIKEAENINFELNFCLYELLEVNTYLEKAYSQIQEEIDALDEELKAKFLSYPIPKAIVEEWEKVK